MDERQEPIPEPTEEISAASRGGDTPRGLSSQPAMHMFRPGWQDPGLASGQG